MKEQTCNSCLLQPGPIDTKFPMCDLMWVEHMHEGLYLQWKLTGVCGGRGGLDEAVTVS